MTLLLVGSLPSRADALADRYEIQGEIVLDRATGLRWARTPAPGKYDWSQAVEYCQGLGPGWRLPAFKELLTLLDPTVPPPFLDPNAFPKLVGNDLYLWFWSISADLERALAWRVGFFNGVCNVANGGEQQHVRCVR